jgi:pimeloyl-ACP methyl ester carboxylesterase
VIVVGYSMGGPIALHLWHRHPELVAGVVLEATALEWRSTVSDRLKWRTLGMLGAILRAWWYPRSLRLGLRRLAKASPSLDPWLAWLEAEVHRNEVRSVVQAGRALAAYDARPWVGEVDVPVGVLLTTQDRLVKPVKQRALASALRAEILEVTGDHLIPWVMPKEFALVTRQLVDSVARRVGRGAAAEDQTPLAHPAAG